MNDVEARKLGKPLASQDPLYAALAERAHRLETLRQKLKAAPGLLLHACRFAGRRRLMVSA
jgi:hypothetical protein